MRMTIAFLLLYLASFQTPPAFTQVSGARGLALDVDIHGRLYILDEKQNTVTLFSREGKPLARIGGAGWENDQFDSPRGIWARNGIDVFVADFGNHRIQRFDRNLNYVSTLLTRESPNPDERFGFPTDVSLSRQGDLYICDTENSRILKVSGLSRVERSFGGFDAGRGRLTRPRQAEIGPEDRVYVQDGPRIVVFDAFGNFTREFDFGLEEGSTAMFADMRGLLIAGRDSLYWLDSADRLALTSGMEALVGPEKGAPRGLAVSGGSMIMLFEEGPVTIPDPRTIQNNPRY